MHSSFFCVLVEPEHGQLTLRRASNYLLSHTLNNTCQTHIGKLPDKSTANKINKFRLGELAELFIKPKGHQFDPPYSAKAIGVWYLFIFIKLYSLQ